MTMLTVHQLMFGFDRATNTIIFQGELENGYKFGVAFPIGHVVVTFDREAAALGYAGNPICGAVDTIDSFIDAVEVIHKKTGGLNDVELGWLGALGPLRGGPFDAIKAIVPAANRAAAYAAEDKLGRALNQKELYQFGAKPPEGAISSITSVASKAYQSTIKKVGQQAVKVARKGVSYVGKGALTIARSKLVGTALSGVAIAFPAVGAPALAAWGAANRAANAYDAARAGVKGASQTLAVVRSNAAALVRNPHPAARLAIAGLSSYRR
jgi:hypothetical protein